MAKSPAQSFFSSEAHLAKENTEETDKLGQKIVNCPHFGKILSEEAWKGRRLEKRKVVCPECGSQRNYKDGMRQLVPGKFSVTSAVTAIADFRDRVGRDLILRTVRDFTANFPFFFFLCNKLCIVKYVEL